MAFDHLGAQTRAGDAIRRWGRTATLMRGGELRACSAGTLDYTPRAKQMDLEGAQRVLIAADDLAIAPDHEQDKLILDGDVFGIVEPVKGPRPGGIAIFYDCAIVYQEPWVS